MEGNTTLPPDSVKWTGSICEGERDRIAKGKMGDHQTARYRLKPRLQQISVEWRQCGVHGRIWTWKAIIFWSSIWSISKSIFSGKNWVALHLPLYPLVLKHGVLEMGVGIGTSWISMVHGFQHAMFDYQRVNFCSFDLGCAPVSGSPMILAGISYLEPCCCVGGPVTGNWAFPGPFLAAQSQNPVGMDQVLWKSGGLEHEWILLPKILGIFIISIDELIFFRRGETTNQTPSGSSESSFLQWTLAGRKDSRSIE